MAYRINYEPIGTDRHKNLKQKNIVVAASLVLLALLVVTVNLLDIPWVQRIILPGDAAVTASALEDLAETLRQGESLMEAVTVFCRSVIANGK